MSKPNVGRLERVPLREVWKHEERDFTAWLQENIDVLNDALGITLVSVAREQAAGSFRIDLVAEDDGGRKVIIENQLEKSNHDHLGKLITYLTALNAQTAIWIVSEPRPEHVAAMAWLNDNNSATFYMLKVEAVRIGGSDPAPILTAIVTPPEDKSRNVESNHEFAEMHDARHRWWARLVEQPGATLHSHISSRARNYITTTAGISGLEFIYVVSVDHCGSELYIDRGKNGGQQNKAIFDEFFEKRSSIEADFGEPLLWERLDDKRASRIRYRIKGGYGSPESEWDSLQTTIVDAMNRLERTLRPYLNALKLKQ